MIFWGWGESRERARVIITNCMNRITEDFKKNLISRYSQKEQSMDAPSSYPQTRQMPSSEHKFMQLFESINKPLTQPTQSPTKAIDHQGKFTTALEEYSNSPSFIDSVILTNQDAIPVNYEPLALVEPPLILNQKAPFDDLIKQITAAFQGEEYRVKTEVINDHFMDLEMFSTILASLGRKNKTAEVKIQAKGKAVIREASSVMPPARSLREFQTDTVELQEQQREESQRMKKIDLILMQLIREKKRKNYVADYQASMQMKLMELLEFILQGQPEYMGLDPTSKTRLVLRNLESFQGKTIEGESKINLLRIFFQEFTALKKSKEEFSTPMKKLENREKPSTKTRQPTKKTTKHQSFSQENSNTEKRSAKSRINTSQKRDEWMGSLS